MKDFKQFILINIIVFVLIVISTAFNFRICLIYNLFKIPCPGCGLSRAIASIISGEPLEALKYNKMVYLVILLYLVYVIWNLIDYKLKKNTFKEITTKYKTIIIILSVCLVCIQWIINLNNVLLY